MNQIEAFGVVVLIILAYAWGQYLGHRRGAKKSDLICEGCQKRIGTYIERNFVKKDLVAIAKEPTSDIRD